MSTSAGGGLSDAEMAKLLDDNPEATAARERASQAETALDAAYEAIAQVTGATATQEGQDGQTEDAGPVRAIWGSSLEVANVMRHAFQFVRSFKKRTADLDSEPYYTRLLYQVRILLITSHSA
jgi:hypothetical protein